MQLDIDSLEKLFEWYVARGERNWYQLGGVIAKLSASMPMGDYRNLLALNDLPVPVATNIKNLYTKFFTMKIIPPHPRYVTWRVLHEVSAVLRMDNYERILRQCHGQKVKVVRAMRARKELV